MKFDPSRQRDIVIMVGGLAGWPPQHLLPKPGGEVLWFVEAGFGKKRV